MNKLYGYNFVSFDEYLVNNRTYKINDILIEKLDVNVNNNSPYINKIFFGKI